MIKLKNQSGQALYIVIITVTVVLIGTLLTITGSQLYYQNSNYNLEAEQAINLAESGIDTAIIMLNNTGGSYSGEAETTLGKGSFSVVITNRDSNTKTIEATGYIPNKLKPRVKRTIKVDAARGVGVAFIYGVQVGEGGLEMGQNNKILGSVYSNGNITVSKHDNEITGDVWVAGGTKANPEEQTDCTLNCIDFLYGKRIGTENRMSVAQSFTLPGGSPNTLPLNKISLKLKKFGTPASASVRIMEDDGGQPDKNNILALGTLDNRLVTADYGWIDITFDSSPLITRGEKYWIMIDIPPDSNNANYWSWQSDQDASYVRGEPKWSDKWNAGNAIWNVVIPPSDLSFKIYTGGINTVIDGNTNFVIKGDAHANTIKQATIGSGLAPTDAYYQSIVNSTVNGSSCSNNAGCHPNSIDPPPKSFPISDANINAWKQEAESYGVFGNINSCVAIFGPGKYVGDVLFDNNCIITVKSPIWITGNFTLNNTNLLKLADEYGSTSGVIIVDGLSTLDNNNKLLGTDEESSILMLLSTYYSKSNGIPAIDIKNNGNTGVFYAGNGIIQPGTNNEFFELTAWKITILANSLVTYETGIASSFFQSGPSGAYSLVKGTYQVK